MGKYTAYNEKVDKYIKKNYLDKIVSSFVDDLSNRLISVILFGGFGKGEGSIQAIGGKPVPYNDFDLYIVTEEKLSDGELDKISMNASKEIGMGGLEIAYFPEESYDSKKFFHVDVRCIPYDGLNKLMTMQRYYELKYGSQIIYGKKDVLDRMKIIDPKDIPVSDGLRNLFNKLHQMLLGLKENYNEDQKRIRIFWSYKCYLSICEVLLILDDKFVPTAFEKNELFGKIYQESFPDLHDKIPDLLEKVQKATDFKLKPKFNVDHEELWNQSLKDLLIVFEYYLMRMTGSDNVKEAINGKLPYTYFKPYLKEKYGFNLWPLQYGLNLLYFGILWKKDGFYFNPLFNWKDVGLRMTLPIYYLLKFKVDGDSENLDKAYDELRRFIKVEDKDFWYLVERSLKAYGLYYEQRLL